MKKLFFIFCLTFSLFAEVFAEDFGDDEFLEEFEDEFVVEKKSDPFKSYNRVMTGFNDGVYEYVVYPVSKGYKFVVHKKIRQSVNNAFYNVMYPTRLLNNLLQGEFSDALEETGYFLINSTLGLFGLFDVAKNSFDMKSHDEDFGQTLGKWGVGAGPHIVLPFLGPSNLRDIGGFVPDSYVNYMNYMEHRNYNIPKNGEAALGLKVYQVVNSTSLNIEQYHKIKEDAIDLYPYLRDSYEQYRNNQIKE